MEQRIRRSTTSQVFLLNLSYQSLTSPELDLPLFNDITFETFRASKMISEKSNIDFTAGVKRRRQTRPGGQ